MIKIQTIPKDMAIMLTLFIVFGTIDYIWASNLCDKFAHNILFYIALVLQFYFTMEVKSMHTSDLLSFDFRSHAKKLKDKHKEQDLMIEAARGNLLMRISTGELNQPEASVIFRDMVNFLEDKPLALQAPEEPDFELDDIDINEHLKFEIK